MKILFINYSYVAYWQQLYASRTGLQHLSYQEQVEVISSDHCMFNGVYSHYLKKLGYDCEEFFYNIVPLQQTWARENGVKWNKATFMHENALEKLRRFKPDIVFLFSAAHDKTWIAAARSYCPSIRLFVRWCANTVPMDTLKGYDLVLTSARGLEQLMLSEGLNVRRVPFAFDSRIPELIKDVREKDIPLSFIGNIVLRKGFHIERSRIILRLIDEKLLTPFVPKPMSWKYQTYLRIMNQAYFIASHCGFTETEVVSLPVLGRHLAAGHDIDFNSARKISKITKGSRYGLEMYRILKRSLASFNVHIDAAGDYVGNIRMYEVTGVGTCLLTDWKKDLSEYFEIDKEVVAYRSEEEAIEKAQWLANNPKTCITIGKAAQERVRREHTYENRALLMHDIFCKQLKG